MSARIKWLWLATRRAVPARVLGALLDAFGSPEQIYAADRRALAGVPGVQMAHTDALCDKALDEAERIAETCQQQDIHILTLADSGYPERLRNIPDPPIVLYVRGMLPDLDASPGLAVVGTRKASPYGLATAETMSRQLAEAGFVIVSGLAEGIDGAAARGALRCGGKTVAVLACGVDRCYPAMHRNLMGDVLLSGAVISEYPPGEPPLASRFPVRNRIISGLSIAALVVEAPQRSGALITAHTALDQGRDVFAIPGNLDAPNSAGCNRLIANGEAALVCSAADILREYAGMLRERIPEPQPSGLPLADKADLWSSVTRQLQVARAEVAPDTPLPLIPESNATAPPAPVLSEEETAIVRAIGAGAGSVDTIADQTGLPAAVITASLTMLELSGVLNRQNGRLQVASR